MFKKVYIEITNSCNLKCSFCALNKRKKEFLSLDNLDIILNKLKGYTEYVYFHVMGEPLLHPNINEMIKKSVDKGFKVSITTNGYLIKNIDNNCDIRQINISLHSFSPSNGLSIDEYLDNIFNVVDKLNNTYIKYRLWVDGEYKKDILDRLCKKYNIDNINGTCKLCDNVYFEEEKQFIWPDVNNNYVSDVGSCRGTRDHIGILVDGTVIPCCLDNEGVINLGNIYKNDLNDIISSDLFKSINEGFLHNKKVCELCKHCNFYDLRRQDGNKRI